MSAQRPAIYLLFCIATITLLLLSALNIENYLAPKKVLGTEIESTGSEINSEEIEFWEDFLSKNPDYIPGWIELGRYEKVKQIDPNYFQEP